MRLVIVGGSENGGGASARAALQRRAAELGVAEHVRLLAQVGNPFPLMRAASVLAVPSLWEGAPNVLLEALACGTPVVASRTAGNAETILAGGRHGVLADPRGPAEFARGLLRQLDPASRIAPGGRAAAFDRSVSLAAYQRLLEDLAASSLV